MAQYVYLVRHAAATERGTLEVDDHRWLTDEGRRRFYRAARRLRRREGREAVAAILTSPLPRAVMTAELLCRALRRDGPVEVCAELGPEAALWPALELLLRKERPVAVVGHEPLLGALLRELCGPEAPAKLRKGQIAALSLGRRSPRARLRYLIEA